MSGKLIMCKGLPGSGKSTWSAQRGAVVVNKDLIRAENKKDWSYDVEKETLRVRDFRISEALSKGLTVISDDTNLARKHEVRLRELAKKYKATFEINDSFLAVSVEDCIERDLGRKDDPESHYVGEKVIRDMAEKFLGGPRVEVKPTPTVRSYVVDGSKPRAVLCDLDGTLALHNGRGPYDTAKADTDLLNDPVHEILHMAEDDGCRIVYVSGREDKFFDITQGWLRANNCPEGLLMMRQTDDKRNDAIVKLEIFDTSIRDYYNVRFVLDDRDRVVKMWRELGLTCLQVAYGDF